MTEYEECRMCGSPLHRHPEDGAWVDDAGASGCGVDEHEPGGFSQYAADDLARRTPWYDDPPEREPEYDPYDIDGCTS